MSALNFDVLNDTRPKDVTLPAFMVSTTRGFLPRQDPIVALPKDFDALDSLLQRMPIKTQSGQPGLLAHGTLGDSVLAELPDLSSAIEEHRGNLPLMNALYRDYSFLASAYLLEPCHHQKLKDGTYGLARDRLPKCIALPITKVAEMYIPSLERFNPSLTMPQRRLQALYGVCRLLCVGQLSPRRLIQGARV
jgi:indoleamine 2,3-dioxygenase